MKICKKNDCMTGLGIYYTKDSDLTIYEISGPTAYELWNGDEHCYTYNTLEEAVVNFERFYPSNKR